MKLTQFAFAAIIVLLAVAGYLTIKSDLDGRLETQNDINSKVLAKLEELDKKQSNPLPAPVATPAPAPVAAAPVTAPVPQPPRDPAAAAALAAAAAIPPDAPLAPEDDPRMLADENLDAPLGEPLPPPDLEVGDIPGAVAADAGIRPRNALQRQIAALPAIAKVKQYAETEGMIVLDRGSNVGLRAGAEFALRRNASVIGRIRISETINPTECVADVVPGSMPPGMVPAAEDDVIQYDQ